MKAFFYFSCKLLLSQVMSLCECNIDFRLNRPEKKGGNPQQKGRRRRKMCNGRDDVVVVVVVVRTGVHGPKEEL